MAQKPGHDNLHSGHRQRLKERFINEGIDNMEDHEVLELLLFFAIPRIDTNELAHRIILEFGSLAAALDAPYSMLTNIEGVGANAATLMKFIPQMTRAYHKSRVQSIKILNGSDEAGEYLMPYFIGCTEEKVMMLLLDDANRLLSCVELCKGGLTAVEINIRKLIEYALKFNATSVVIAHNHPHSVALPSRDDVACTMRLKQALATCDINLKDHLIFSTGIDENGLLGDFVKMEIIGY